jgi:hypothetical protein
MDEKEVNVPREDPGTAPDETLPDATVSERTRDAAAHSENKARQQDDDEK